MDRQFPIIDPNICMHIEEKRDFDLDPRLWSSLPKAMGREFRERLQDSPTIRYDPTELARLAAVISEIHHAKSHVVTNGMVVVAEVGAELFRLGDSQSYQIRVYLSRRLAAPKGVHCEGKPRDDWTGTRWQYFLDEKCEIVPWPDPSTLGRLVRVTEPVDPHGPCLDAIQRLEAQVSNALTSISNTSESAQTEGGGTVATDVPSYIDYSVGPSDDEADLNTSAPPTIGAERPSHKRSISNAGQSDDGSRSSNGKRPKQEEQD
ncbi:hypothetical protein HD553DRAFT_325798 [Filobasidium floriforme]|uniref:uncharacterized protein n=1 Tax=Filobasidium floriforme TaxID=5210 RepID=UPI001E8E861F|nr:uncharacterized protein HD553DRAFT_325798 [Filobasidium floriforme]KAH8080826.1 hypothetical protein HD553DRAFT_325798 [Filobasidium floriforme]